jgi:hypothetical protein
MKYHIRIFIFIIFCLLSYQKVNAQLTIEVEKEALLLHINYGYSYAGGDLAKRFGNNFGVGGSLEYKLKNDFFVGVDYTYLWGKNVKEKIAQNIYNAKNEIVGIDNHLANLTLRERGFALSASFGKIFRPFNNEDAGVKISVGGGWLQHKVRIVDEYGVVPQILEDYLHGYDRLTNGLLTRQYIGYQYLSSNRRVNFSIGLVLMQGFTKSSRGFNYDTGLKDNARRLDLINGIQVSWVLPFYFNDYSSEIIY